MDGDFDLFRVPAAAKGPLSQRAMLLQAAVWFDQHPDLRYQPILDVEHMAPDALRSTRVTGSAFEGVQGALIHDVDVGGTIGQAMDVLGLSQSDVHTIACYCHGSIVTAANAAARLRQVAATKSD